MTQKKTTMFDQVTRVRDEALEAGRKVWLFGLGTLSLGEEQVRTTYERMVERGEEFDRSEHLLGKTYGRVVTGAKELGEQVEGGWHKATEATLRRAGVPSRDEIHTLIKRVETLTRKVETMTAAR